MEKMWMRAVLVLAMALSFSACAKKKDSSAPAQSNVKNTAPVDPTTVPEAKEGKKGDLPAPGTQKPPKPGRTEQPPGKNPPAGAPTPKEDKKDKDKDKDKGKSGPTQPPVVEGGGVVQTQPPVVEGGGETRPGSELEQLIREAYRYSAAGPDSLRDVLMQQEDKLSDEQKLRDLRFSNSINQATSRFNSVVGQYEVKLFVGKENREIGFLGQATSGSATSMPSNVDGATGSMECVDAAIYETGCETTVVSVRYKKANAKIIFRRTNVKLDAVFPDRRCLTKACDDFYNTFRLTGLNVIDPQALQFASMDSFEVIYGKTGFLLLAVTRDNQVFKVAGPLANPQMYPTLDTPTDRRLAKEDLVDPRTQALRKTQMNDSMGDVRIVQNDGHGNVNLLVKMPLQSNGDRDAFQLRLNRLTKPVRNYFETFNP